jgi:tetratricopeptide (TPR) repeat protein
MLRLSRPNLPGRPGLLALGAAACLLSGGSLAQQAADAPLAQTEPVKALESAAPSDADLAPFRAQLLELAFDAASAMPTKPHVKSRSQAQESVIGACLELDQPARAQAWIERIENWRRGTAWADLALHCIRKGERGAHIERFLERAYVESEAPEEEIGQSWRRDRIRAKLALAHGLLGQRAESMMFRAGLENAEAARLAVFEAERATDEQFHALIETLDEAARIGDFSMTQYALDASAALYKRFYSNEARRTKIEERVEVYWRAAPFGLRIDVLLGFADAAYEHGDRNHALAVLAKTLEQINSARWTPMDYSPVMGRVAAAFQAVGEPVKASECVRAAIDKFEAEREQIWNFERGAALRPIAEAQAALGDTASALATYRRAVEVGAENPNARPRAEDLAATCSSMARAAVEPDAKLFERLRAIRAGLQAPW